MNELGELFSSLCVFSSANLWFKRAIRTGSITAIFNLATCALDQGDVGSALSLFHKHFALTHSPATAFEIAKAHRELHNDAECRRWLRFCAAQGHQLSVQELIRTLDADATDPSSLIHWSDVSRKLDLMRSRRCWVRFRGRRRAFRRFRRRTFRLRRASSDRFGLRGRRRFLRRGRRG
jgi:hypothetical protein